MTAVFRSALPFLALSLPLTAADAPAWSSTESNGKIETTHHGKTLLTWQLKPIENPVGGPQFAGSAFLHPLRTPAGFEWTGCQPDDHKHHFGLWWPWKYIEVDGSKANTWEVQEGHGAHVARSAESVPNIQDGIGWIFHNQTELRSKENPAKPVIDETAHVTTRIVGDAQIIDVELRQKAIGSPVKIVEYRYSGFSWRGTSAWNKDNSTMTTSEGLDRDTANGKTARWVMVSGTTPQGKATVLLMSAATQLAGTPEQLRVWDSKAANGTPFVNFNPVMEKPLPLDDAHPAVSHRKYRVIAADHIISPEEAESEWKKWTAP